MSRVTRLSLSRCLVISFVLVLYQDTGQGATITSCGFENADLCKYIQRKDDQFDWTRGSGATPTANTGPSSACEGSYYLYIDTRYNSQGDKAVLQTQDVSWRGWVCVSLAYHMYGEDIGTLTLSVSDSLGMSDLLHKSGNQGNTWIKERISFSINNGTSVVIEGIRGSGDKRDIAIDDFSVVTGTCKPTVSLPYSCSFESDLCDMSHRDWQARWLRTRKDNAAPETGSSGESGGSWFLSLASDEQVYSTAIIVTPRLNFTGDICVRFKYYLSSNVPTVKVYDMDPNMFTGRLFYNDSAATGATWRSASLTVRNFVRNRIIGFQGQTPYIQAGSMALDEIYISRNICDDCAVNNGGCSQTCTNTDTGPMCSCRMGYVKFEETGCQDIDECSAGTDACSHECQNEDGTYSCHCPGGWSPTGDGYNCQDIDECATATDNECDHVCINVEGSYNCSCRDTYILATDGRHCIDCESAYQKRVAASELFISECLTTSSHTEITLDDCLQEACRAQTGVVAYLNMVCNLKRCDGSDLRLNEVSGSTGWDIYVLNTTWPGFIMGGDPECSAGTDACSHECQNEEGTDSCHCPGGWSLTGDGQTCQDIDECAAATDNECDHVCRNVEGSYNCSCRTTYILATDGRHCIKCESAYERRVAASQLLTSDCPITFSHTEITLDDCLQEACNTQTGVVDYFNMVCNLKLCDGSNLRLNTVSGSTGWDIYVLNTTWPGSINGGNPDAFPLVAVVAGVVVPVILLAVIVTAVVCHLRRRGLRERKQSVQHVNDAGQPASVGEVRTPPINVNQAEVGIYDEVMETPERQASVANTQVTCRNAAFQSAHQYLDLDLGLGEYLTPTPKQHDDVQ